MGDAEPANQENREVRKELPEKTLQKDIWASERAHQQIA
jgi:hypothetical protein